MKLILNATLLPEACWNGNMAFTFLQATCPCKQPVLVGNLFLRAANVTGSTFIKQFTPTGNLLLPATWSPHAQQSFRSNCWISYNHFVVIDERQRVLICSGDVCISSGGFPCVACFVVYSIVSTLCCSTSFIERVVVPCVSLLVTTTFVCDRSFSGENRRCLISFLRLQCE